MVAERVRRLGWGFEAERGAIDLHDLGSAFLERERVPHFRSERGGAEGGREKRSWRGIKVGERERGRDLSEEAVKVGEGGGGEESKIGGEKSRETLTDRGGVSLDSSTTVMC